MAQGQERSDRNLSGAGNHVVGRPDRVGRNINGRELTRRRIARLTRCLVVLGLAIVGCGAQAPAFRRQIAWADKGVWLKADLHIHTPFSDGNYPADGLARAAVARGCDVVAITDHSDGGLKAATPAYFDAIRAIRVEHPNLVVVAGLEWNIPPGKGQEHANVLFPSRMETLERFSTFKDRFDDFNKEGENPELGDAGLKWLTPSDRALPLPVVTINHPSRKPSSTSAPKIMFEHWKSVSPAVIGIEGAPGHQKDKPLGSYSAAAMPVDRWDPMVAEVGGTWDTWLGKGLDVWAAMANSDFHGEAGDFLPCQFAATWIYAPDRTIDGVLRALSAGSFFGEHGHIVTSATLEARVPAQARAARVGEVLQVSAGTVATATLRLDVPARDYLDRENRIDRVELIGISRAGARVLFEGPPGATEAFSVPVTVPAGGIVLRARGSRKTPDGNLLFYTNPVRLTTAR